MKKLIALTSFLLILILLSGCTESTGPGPDSSRTASKISNDIFCTLTVNKTVFNLTDSLQINFEVQNISQSVKEFNFSNQQQFAFKLTDDNGSVALFYPNIVQPATSSFTLKPGETKTFSVAHSFKNYESNYIQTGDYYLTAFLADGNSPEVRIRISVT